MTDFSGPEGPATSFNETASEPREASAAADAQEHALGEIVHLKPFAELRRIQSELAAMLASSRGTTDASPRLESVDDRARATLTDLAGKIAALKNVALRPGAEATIAEQVFSSLTLQQRYQVAGLGTEGASIAMRWIGTHLDLVVSRCLMEAIAHIENSNLTDPVVSRTFMQIVEEAKADSVPSFIRWPPPIDLLHRHYGDRPIGPIIEITPDGTAVASYYKSGAFHRDPKEGPAIIRKHLGRIDELEYWVEGKRHRDHRDGPALVTAWLDGQLCHGEEYWEHGQWHRPASEGPAIRQVAPDGKVLFEIYVEEGKLHRDPGEGPAWVSSQNGEKNVQYATRGLPHRDEAHGPAVLSIDEATGVVLHEEYFRRGVLHRDNGPAVRARELDGGWSWEDWYRDGRFYRDPKEGPVYRAWDQDGNVVAEEYSAEGDELSASGAVQAEGVDALAAAGIMSAARSGTEARRG